MDIDIIATGLQFPEGPVALADGAVLVTEIAGGTLTRVEPEGTRTTVAECGGGPNGATIGPDGALYICNNGGQHFARDGDRLFNALVNQPDDYVGGSIQRVDIEFRRGENPVYRVRRQPAKCTQRHRVRCHWWVLVHRQRQEPSS